MPARLVLAPAVLAAGAHHRFGLGILAVIVLAVLGFGGFRMVERRRAQAPKQEDEWRSSEPLGSGDSAPARPAATPGAGAATPAVPPRRSPASEASDVSAGTSRAKRAAPAPPPTGRVFAETSPAPTTAPGAPGAAAGAGTVPATRRAAASPSPHSAGAGGDWAVEIHRLTKRFGPNAAVDDVELLVPRGCAFGCLGPNGAGKTTLIRTLLGLTRADSGTMSLLGLPVPAERSRALARVGAIVDEPRFHGHLTGRENLSLLAAARGAPSDERIAPALERVGLHGRADDRVAAYSMGMRQRLGVAACLLGDPELLILDEPMNGLDPAGIHEMRAVIRGLVDEGRTVMLSSHLLDEVERTCDAVAIVDRGRVVRQGPIEELLRGASSAVVRVECSDPALAGRLIEESGIGNAEVLDEVGLSLALPAGSTRQLVAEVNRLLVGAGISVYRLEEVRASLEDWFLTVTSRLGAER